MTHTEAMQLARHVLCLVRDEQQLDDHMRRAYIKAHGGEQVFTDAIDTLDRALRKSYRRKHTRRLRREFGGPL